MFEISTFKFFKCKVSCKTNFGNLRPKTPHMGTFRLEFKKTIFIFEIKTLKFVKMQSFMLKKKKLGTKIAIYLGVFGLKFEKKLFPYLNSERANLSKCKVSY